MFVDRVSTYPNRYKIVPQSGAEYYATLERADLPVTEGTPLNAATLNPLVEEIARLRAEIDAMKGVNLEVRYGDNRVKQGVDPLLFDYFLLIPTEQGATPRVFESVYSDIGAQSCEAVRYIGPDRPKGVLRFSWGSDAWELDYIQTNTDGTTTYPAYSTVYGFKYPIQEG